MNPRILTIAALTLTLAACSDSASDPGDFATEDLSTELAVTPAHFHLWETEGTFTVTVVDPDGDAVTDFTTIQVDRRLFEDETWHAIELTRDGDFYEATYTFDTSGEYELRVSGMRPSDDEMKILRQEQSLLEVVRAHSTMGGYTVSFEVFPGHIHRNDSPTFVWWFEGAGDPAPPLPHPPEEAPTMSVVCDAGTVQSPLVETEEGRWDGIVELPYIGDCDANIHFIGADDLEHTYTVPIHISEAHG